MNNPQDATLRIIADRFGMDRVSHDDHLLTDLGSDALDIIELVMDLEEEFNIEISDDELESLFTVSDVCDLVNEKCLVQDSPQ